LFGNPRADGSAAWVQVSLRNDEAGDEVGAKSSQRDGDGPTHAVAEHGAALQAELIQELGDAIRMVVERVAELFGSVAVAVTEEIDQERAMTDQARAGDNWSKVRCGCTAQPMKPDQGQVLSRKLQIPKIGARGLQEQTVHLTRA
jgi:hypothetical protein